MAFRNFIAALSLAFIAGVAAVADEPEIDFNRDVRPILAAKCFACHGPDENKREAGLRLDIREEAVDYGAIVPGSSDESELIRRIQSDDADEVMPPSHLNDALTEDEKQVFVDWVKSGAPYAKHWAFVPPQQSKLPEVKDADWPRNAIDHFVLAKLEAEGLSPSPEADKYSLVRRVYLDLTGLPPTPFEADDFVKNQDPQAYEKLVDKLLSSPRYGERWARLWLDLARYSDTNGYEKDRPRSIWPYRDWVINAINRDMSFDQFSIQQLAGDMLPAPNTEQLVATGFHRNTMLNEEGGIDPLEYRFYAMVDRVATTGTVWLGMSTGCAQCHTHKYDPITHTDYYSLMALMNNADEPDQVVRSASVDLRRKQLLEQIETLESKLPDQFPPSEGDGDEAERRKQNLADKFSQWLDEQQQSAITWNTIVPKTWDTNLPRLEILEDGSLLSTGDVTKRDVFQLKFDLDEQDLPVTAIQLEALQDDRLPDSGPGRAYYEGRKGSFFLSEWTTRFNGQERSLRFADPEKPGVVGTVIDGDGSSGWSGGPRPEPQRLVINLKEPITETGQLEIEMLFERHFVASLGRFRLSVANDERVVSASNHPEAIETLLCVPQHDLNEQQRQQLRQHFLRTTPLLAEARQPIDELRKKLPSHPITLVMSERPADNPRKTFRHHRGEYLSPKEEVTPAIPEFLQSEDGKNPTNRLQLARWLVSEDNPLVARVTVNRDWQALFGIGLQRTSDDFGTQAAPPTHPELLDWLACEFIKRGWSRKQLHRLIVTSATYRQSSQVGPDLLARDPENELLARGPRFRVQGEMVRDIMLKSSGLLSEKMYGPGVRPPQPSTVTAVAYGRPGWNASQGEDRYRRSIYTFSKRTAPFAAYATFDAPTGENCVARRDRSNTPLQALTLLNDEMYLEMARALAKLAVEKKLEPEATAQFMFRRLLTRPASAEELKSIVAFFHQQLERLDTGQLNAAQIAGNDQANQQLAGWTMVARVLMNLDETITKP